MVSIGDIPLMFFTIKSGTDLRRGKLRCRDKSKLLRLQWHDAQCKLNYTLVLHAKTNCALIHMCDVCAMRIYFPAEYIVIYSTQFILSPYMLEYLPRLSTLQIGSNTCPYHTRTERCLAFMDRQPMDQAVHCAQADYATLHNLQACPYLRSMQVCSRLYWM